MQDFQSTLISKNSEEFRVRPSRFSKKRIKMSKKLFFSRFPEAAKDCNEDFVSKSLPKIVKCTHKSRYFTNNIDKSNEFEITKEEVENLKQKLLEKDIEIKALKNLYLEVHQELKREKSLNYFEVKYSSPKISFKTDKTKAVSFELPGRKFSVPSRPDTINRYSSHKLLSSSKPKKVRPIIKFIKFSS